VTTSGYVKQNKSGLLNKAAGSM